MRHFAPIASAVLMTPGRPSGVMNSRSRRVQAVRDGQAVALAAPPPAGTLAIPAQTAPIVSCFTCFFSARSWCERLLLASMVGLLLLLMLMLPLMLPFASFVACLSVWCCRSRQCLPRPMTSIPSDANSHSRDRGTCLLRRHKTDRARQTRVFWGLCFALLKQRKRPAITGDGGEKQASKKRKQK